MRVTSYRPATLLIPLVTAAALALPSAASAADPVVWRNDYNSARKEASEKGLSLCVVIGTDNCFYCRKLEGGPLKDPAVAGTTRDQLHPAEARRQQRPEHRKGVEGANCTPPSCWPGPTARFTPSSRGISKLTASVKR